MRITGCSNTRLGLIPIEQEGLAGRGRIVVQARLIAGVVSG